MAIAEQVADINDAHLLRALQEAAEQLEHTGSELILDFSSVRRIDSSAVQAMEKLAVIAEEKAVKVALRSVNIDLYKALKLVKLTQRFSFVN